MSTSAFQRLSEAIGEQGVRFSIQPPDLTAAPRKGIVRIPRGLDKAEAANIVVRRLAAAGLLHHADTCTLDAKDWTAEIEVENVPNKKPTTTP
jgi:hypothetical protein